MLVFFSVLYNPGPNALENIALAKSVGIQSIVYLNKVDAEYLKQLEALDIVILGNNVNDGLGVAFSEIEELLKKREVENFIYFDQDTVVGKSAWLDILKSYADHFLGKDVGMLYYSGYKRPISSVVISSGCVFSIRVIDEIGNHDASFFVEGVDYEFCLRLKQNGYRIVNVFNAGIDHDILQDQHQKQIFGIKYSLRVYGQKRLNDFNVSHAKLIKMSLRYKQLRMAVFFLKSFIVFNCREFFSRFMMVVM